MSWLNSLLTTQSALQTVVVLSLICSLGLALGKIRVGGVSLGVAFVFFIGILAGHLGLAVDAQMLDYAETFGLVVFVYMLGLHVGPNFFSSLKHEGMELNLWSFAVIALGTVMAVATPQGSHRSDCPTWWACSVVPPPTPQPSVRPSRHWPIAACPRGRQRWPPP